MIYFLRHLLRAGFKRKSVSLVLAYLCLLLLSSLLITIAEPPDSALTQFDQALWWSIVTSTTVGYGDLFPVSNAGRIVAVLLPMFLGIGIGAAFITHIASSIIERRDKRMHGEKDYKGNDHILIVGSTDETGHLIDQIRRDKSYADRDIVLAADISRHPYSEADNVFFVKGRADTSETLTRASAETAGRIVVHTGNDEESLFALINALKQKKKDCEITVRCISTQSLDTFSGVPGDFQIIMQMTAEMMVQAMQDKVHLPLQVLLRNDAGDEMYHIVMPENASEKIWWELHRYFKETYNYLTFAMQTKERKVIINPDTDHPVKPGDGIWLIAASRPIDIVWP